MLLPIAVLALVVALWEAVVRVGHIPPYVLPSPQLIYSTLLSDWAMLSAAPLVTLTTTLEGFFSPRSAASRWRCCSTSRA